MNPPETPIDLPTSTTDDTTGIDDLLPTGGTDTTDDERRQGRKGGKGGKGKNNPVDLSPVTTTVTEVVTGVVTGVNGLLSGLTGVK